MLSSYHKDDKGLDSHRLEEAKYRELRSQMMAGRKLTELESRRRNRDYDLAQAPQNQPFKYQPKGAELSLRSQPRSPPNYPE